MKINNNKHRHSVCWRFGSTDCGSNHAFSRGRQLVSSRFENRWSVPEHRKSTTTNMYITRARCESQQAVGSNGLNARSLQGRAIEFKFLAWSSMAQALFQRAFSLLEIRFQRPELNWIKLIACSLCTGHPNHQRALGKTLQRNFVDSSSSYIHEFAFEGICKIRVFAQGPSVRYHDTFPCCGPPIHQD